MDESARARTMLNEEARSLLTRLGRVRPFALQETMVPAAALAPATQIAIERLLIGGRYQLRAQVLEYLRWLASEGAAAPPDEQQRRFTLVRMRFNDALSQFDAFSELITQRSENETGVWLAGLDVLAAEGLSLPGGYFEEPLVICHLARGPGAAIRRARTRLPGGASSPVAIVRVPRERMVGQGIASSLMHEVGHQAAALLDLVPSLRAALGARDGRGSAEGRPVWVLWSRWISEIVADFWSVAKLGIGSTLGLIGVVSLPGWFVFRLNADDPHPIPWIRVKVSCAIGERLYPHAQWRQLARLWESLYPPTGQAPETRSLLAALEASIPQLMAVLLDHRPVSLHGRSLREVMPLEERAPERLVEHHRAWRRSPARMREAAPSLAFAVLGQARSMGRLEPESESRIVGNLLTFWALRSTLRMTEVCASAPRHPAASEWPAAARTLTPTT